MIHSGKGIVGFKSIWSSCVQNKVVLEHSGKKHFGVPSCSPCLIGLSGDILYAVLFEIDIILCF